MMEPIAEEAEASEHGKQVEDSVLDRIASLVKMLANAEQASSPEASPGLLVQQDDACMELRKLARTSTANKDLIGKLGGINALLKTMKADAKKGKVRAGPISALEDIAARHASNSAALLKLGGVEAVLQAMEQHPENPQVQHTGCKVLQNAAMATQQSQEQVASLGGAEAIVRAMAAHPTIACV